MSKILVVDDMPIFREPIAASLRQEGFETECAANGKEALEAIATAPPALVLLDLGMPVMDGLTCLKHLREDPATEELPVIILTALAERDRILDAARLGTQGYLLKSRFSTEELVTRIRTCLDSTNADQAKAPAATTVGIPTPDAAGAPAPESGAAPAPVLTRETTLARLEEYVNVKTLAGNVAQVLQVSSSPRAAAHELAEALRHDPVLAARVLQLANSAAYQTGKAHISSIDDAVRIIGFNTIRSLASSIGIFETFPAEAADGFTVIRCWQHSFAVASIMDRIVPASDATPPGLAHLVGLCHELAEIILRQLFPVEYDSAVQRARSSGGPLHRIEAEVLGVPRFELVSRVLAKLQMPPEVAAPIVETGMRAFDHRLRVGPLARALRLAIYNAHGCLLAPAAESRVGPVSRMECQETLGDGNPRPIDSKTIREEVITLTNVLVGLSRSDCAKASQPMFPRTRARVWYARHKTFSQFDPLGIALQMLGQVERFDRLPHDTGELGGFDAIIAVTPSAKDQQLSQADVAQVAAGGLGRPVPTLYLVNEDATPVRTGAGYLTIDRYPLRLSDLAGFLSGLRKPQPAGAGA